MIRRRHALVADLIIRELSSDQPAHHLEGVVRARNRLEDVGFNAPSWEALADGVRPEVNSLDDAGPGMPQDGWQFKAMLNVDDFFMSSSIWPRLPDASKALLVRFPGVPRLAPSPSVAPSSSLFAFLPVWPSPRRPVQRARMWECWVAVDLLWKVQLPVSAEKPAAASQSMLQFATLTLVSLTEQMTAGWRSLQTGCRCSMLPRLQSTRLSFLSCAGMGRLILDV